jgi:hypothetical protein
MEEVSLNDAYHLNYTTLYPSTLTCNSSVGFISSSSCHARNQTNATVKDAEPHTTQRCSTPVRVHSEFRRIAREGNLEYLSCADFAEGRL